jgi:hypothetical protein
MPSERVEAILAGYRETRSGRATSAALGEPMSNVYYVLRREGIERRPSGRPRVHPPALPRECPTCGSTFTPAADKVAKGEGIYCSRLCARSSDAGRAAARRGGDRRARTFNHELARICEERDSFTAREAAAELGVAENNLTGRYIAGGFLPGAEKVKLTGGEAWVIPRGSLTSLARVWVKAGGPSVESRLRHLDPDQHINYLRARGVLAKRAAARGLTEHEQEVLERNRLERRRARLRDRGGRPRKDGLRVELLGFLEDVLAMYQDEPLSAYEVCMSVALLHLQRDRTYWPAEWISPSDEGDFKRSSRRNVVARVNWLIGAEIKKRLQALTSKPS